MPERQQANPAPWVAVLGLLGIYAVSQAPKAGMRDGGSPAASKTEARATEPATYAYKEVEEPIDLRVDKDDLEIFSPLIDSISGAGGTREERKKVYRDFLERVNTNEEHSPTARCLIATIPDPVRCTISFRFDELLDAIERAASARSFVLDRWNFPWAGHGQRISGSGTFRPRWDSQGFRLETQARSEQTSLGFEARSGQPGLIVFKNKYAEKKPAERATDTDYLLIFLVSETPTYGLDQRALVRALDDAERIERPFFRNFLDHPREATLRILGPNYSGVMTSLEQALSIWLNQKANRLKSKRDPDAANSYSIQVISGGATQVDKPYFESLPTRLKLPNGLRATVTFQATVHQSVNVIRAILNYLDPGGKQPTAIFYEANTGGIQGIFEKIEGKTQDNTSFYTYPLDIAQIRRIYDSQGLLRRGTADVVRSPGQLNSAEDRAEQARDVVPDQTTEVSARTENLILSQTLTDAERRKIRIVGIISSDPDDVVFLVRLVRQFCPNAQIFTNESELRYVNPLTISDMRGLIVGSTYPLYLGNQSWSFPHVNSNDTRHGDHNDTRHVFPSQNAEAEYNGLVAQLREMERESILNPNLDLRFELRDYGEPFPPPNVAKNDRPPIWIGVVGERATYPLAYRTLRDIGQDNNVYIYEILTENSSVKIAHTWISAWISLFCLLTVAVVLVLVDAWILIRFTHKQEPPKKKKSDDTPKKWFDRLKAYDPEKTPILKVFIDRTKPKCPLRLWNERSLCAGLAVLLIAYLVVAFPIFGDRAPWGVQLATGFVIVAQLATMTVLALVIKVKKPRITIAATILSTLVFALILAGVFVNRRVFCDRSFLGLPETACDAAFFLAAERVLSVTSGVSPIFSTLFLAGAFGLLVAIRIKIKRINRDFHFYTESIPYPDQPETETITEFYEYVSKYVRRLRKRLDGLLPARFGFDSDDAQGFIVSLTLVTIFVWLTGWFERAWTLECYGFDLGFKIGLTLMYALVAFGMTNLLIIWRIMQKWIRLVARLPLVKAFDRLPNRVGTWFFSYPTPHARMQLVSQQISALRLRLDHSLKFAWSKAHYPKGFDWSELEAELKEQEKFRDCDGSGSDPTKLVRLLYLMLERYWMGLPVEEGYLDHPNVEGAGTKRSSPSSAAQNEAGCSTLLRKGLDQAQCAIVEEWARIAEDLIALQTFRWFGTAMAFLWARIGFLVVASIAMLLAITSYPFTVQSALINFVGLEIVVLLLIVGKIVLDSNRDEIVSRVSGTTPGRLSFDSPLLINLVAYIAPLLGALAALSFDFADLIRSWLDPIVRLFV